MPRTHRWWGEELTFLFVGINPAPLKKNEEEKHKKEKRKGRKGER